MKNLRKQSMASFGQMLVLSMSLFLGAVPASAQGTYTSSRTLTPVNTGRSITFAIGSPAPDRLAVKTNLVYWAAMTPNLAVEVALSPRLSLELGGGFHSATGSAGVFSMLGSKSEGETTEIEGKGLEHWLVKPELRYWIDEPFSGHFFGASAVYGAYDLGGYDIPMLFEKEFFYDGTAYGGSLLYGYHWAFSNRFRAEFSLGAGVLQMTYDKKTCADESCDAAAKRFKKTYFGPTQLGVKLVFMLK
jgi:hypothetical protein